MVWVKNTIDICKNFGLKLLISELLVIMGCLVFFLVFMMQAPSASSGGLTEILRDPFKQEQIFWALVLLFAPLIALFLTFYDALKRH